MPEPSTSRLEAFSDGVIAIIITIMVLELRAPAEPTLGGLLKVAPEFVTYAISFLVIAIIWVNHHPLIQAASAPTARLVWSNFYLLFWMSFVPFVTEFLGRDYREPLAVALYGLDLFLCTSGFYFLRVELIHQNREEMALVKYHKGIQRKNAFAAVLYLLSVPLAYLTIYASFGIFVLLPAVYFLPEKRLFGE
ncbi:MAG: TMEM175 family protein [Candidatus Sulfotelmatobacter sp.]